MTNKRNLFKNQDYYKIRDYCLENGKLFEDDFFEHDVKISDVNWLRPEQIVQEPRFIVDGASRFDAVQGKTTNCWLVVAMANLTMNQTYFQHVVPQNQSFINNYAGIFFFRIWQCGKWVEVVVDDRLPTKAHQLIYTSSKTKNEFWSALLEKAYVKLYGSYADLTVGWFCEGMVDFTGGVVETVQVTNPRKIEFIIRQSLKKSSFLCVFMSNSSAKAEKVTTEGLVKGHAYSINNLINLGENDLSRTLVRLRNPWGELEWTGAWSDSSPQWRNVPEELKKNMGLVRENDGDFWMSIVDFTKHFESINICHLSPELFKSIGGKENIGWQANYFRGEWIKGVNAGGYYRETFHLNPQCRIILTDSDEDEDNLCTVIIALMQKNKNRNTWHAINFTAFLLEGPTKDSKYRLSKSYVDENFESSKSSKLKEHREIVVREKWKPGVYCIIPSTKYPGQEGQFLLRIHSEKKVVIEESEEHFEKIGRTMESISQQILKEETLCKSSEAVRIGKEDRKSMGKSLLQKSDKEMEDFYHKVAGDLGEISWEGLQLILDYALGNLLGTGYDPSTEPDGVINTVVEVVNSWLTGNGWWSSKPRTNVTFSKDKCRKMIKMLDDDFSGKLGPKEFNVLWKRIKEWESVFLNNSKDNDLMIVPDLKYALALVGHNINTCDLGRLARRYSDNNQQLGFDDFIMCAIEAESGWL